MLSPSFPEVHLPHLAEVRLPPMLRCRLRHPRGEPVADIAGAVEEALAKSQRLRDLRSGAKVAVAVGSRGIAHIATLARSAVAGLKAMGLEPFVVPAMGSHGGGTAEGQVAVLAKLGVTEGSVDAPIRATMDTVEHGATLDGIPCRFDAEAAKADAVVAIARVKSHTSFDRPIESGLIKMVAVGLGKADGARNVHRLGPRGYTEVLPALARIALDHAPVACGIAVVENAHKELVVIEGVEPESFFEADERLLKQAKALLARLPFPRIDGLIVELMGKEISGTGMDIAITGRADIRGIANTGPFIHKIAVLGLTEETAGNAVGLGVADYTTREVANGVDLKAVYMNAITSTMVEKGRIPVVLPDELSVIQALVATCWATDLDSIRLCQIRSTLHLGEILVSPALYRDVEGREDVERISDPEPLEFAADRRLLTRC
jgi:hypothetical protein